MDHLKERVAAEGEPCVEDDLHVSPEELKRRRQGEPGEGKGRSATHEPIEQEDQERQIRRGHDLASMSEHADGHQIRGERERKRS